MKNFLEDEDRKIQKELWDIIPLLKRSLKNRSLHISPVFNSPLQITNQSGLPLHSNRSNPFGPPPAPQLLNSLFPPQQPYLFFFSSLYLTLSQCSLQRFVLLYFLHRCAGIPSARYHLCWDIVLLPLPGWRTLIETRCLYGRYVLTDGSVLNSGNRVFVIKWCLHLIQCQPPPIFTSGAPWAGCGRYLGIANVILFHGLVQSPL